MAKPSSPVDALGWEIYGHRPSSAEARRVPRAMAGVNVLESTVPLCSGRRLGTHEGPAIFAIVYILEGLEWGYGSGGRCLVKAGDVLTWHTAHALGFEVLEPVKKVSFLFDASTVEKLLPRPASLCDMHVPRASALGPMLAGFFEGLTKGLDGMPERYHEGAMAMALELVSKGMRLDRDEVAKGPEQVLLTRLIQHIERKLAEPDLNAESLASTHGLSVRYLEAVFAELGTSVGEYIRESRLARCREALAVQDNHPSPIDLARQWGFEDPKHFSDAFRRRFGVSPDEYRRLRAVVGNL